MARKIVTILILSAALAGLSPVHAIAQPSGCRDVASLACQTQQWEAALAAFDQNDLGTTQRLLVELLKRADMARPANEDRRARALQFLAIVRLSLQDVEGSKDAGRQALAIWQRRANPAETEDRRITLLNLANALTMSKDLGAGEALVLQLIAELGPPQPQTHDLQVAALEVLSNILADRQGPMEEQVRRRSEIVALQRGRLVHPDDKSQQKLILARALGNLSDTQNVAETYDAALASLAEAISLMETVLPPPSVQEQVLMRSRYLPILKSQFKRCEAEAAGLDLLPRAEPLGGRILSQILTQHGENYKLYGDTDRAAPLFQRVTALELAMACPATATGRARNGAASCMGSPVLIDHLRAVGILLRYEGQGRAAAGYRSLVQAGDMLRARTLGGFALNRDASNAYSASRDIFRDQITTAWAINDLSAVPKVAVVPWNCPPRR